MAMPDTIHRRSRECRQATLGALLRRQHRAVSVMLAGAVERGRGVYIIHPCDILHLRTVHRDAVRAMSTERD